MKFLVDNQLPIQLAIHLRKFGHDCQHVLDLGLEETDDIELWVRAGRDERIMVSKDDDFVFLATRPGDTGRLIWVRVGNCRNAALLASFDRIHDELVRAIESGQRIVEVR
jgi:predicted nuclease of predicted toxin-antitoxin system